MSGPPEHATIVKAAEHRSAWIVVCRRCGQVGVPEDYRADALAIAERHTAVGGFERRP